MSEGAFGPQMPHFILRANLFHFARMVTPTQKPLLLLERIIELVTHKGGIVLDPFCGSGTTCVAAKLLGRKYIGIDKLQEAFDLKCQRLLNPIKTESNLLKAGRESYISADQHALGLLSGIPFNPVHRNKCIDAILVQQFEDTPVLVRVQRSHETLSEASLLLLKAKKKKQAKKVILIQTHTNDLFNELEADKGIIILQSPSVQIASALFPTK